MSVKILPGESLKADTFLSLEERDGYVALRAVCGNTAQIILYIKESGIRRIEHSDVGIERGRGLVCVDPKEQT